MPTVTVVLPIFNSIAHLSEAIDSVISQTYTDWDMLCINEYGSDDGSAEMIQRYAELDRRIKLVQNRTRLGLGSSLNLGLNQASGIYIARMDADDLMREDRLEKEVAYMDAHPDVAVVGSYQHHFGPTIDWVHKPPINPEQMKANLLFFCDLCHSTLLMRKAFFIEHSLYYDENYLAEDYELWTRVSKVGQIANIPQVLGEYRVGEDNITNAKKERLDVESGQLVLRNLKDNLHMVIQQNESYLFNGWVNPYDKPVKARKERLKTLKVMLADIIKENEKVQYYDRECLMKTISAKWNWACNFKPFNQLPDEVDENSIFKVEVYIPLISRFIGFWKNNKGFKKKIRKIVSKLSSK